MLLKGFTSVEEKPKKERIQIIEKEIVRLQNRLKEFADKFDDFSTAAASKIMSEISSLTIEKMNLENDLLIVSSAEKRTKLVMAEFNKLPYKIESFEDFDYRKLYSRAIITGRENILLVVGNKDVSKINKNTKGELAVETSYTVRITTFKLRLSVYVNI